MGLREALRAIGLEKGGEGIELSDARDAGQAPDVVVKGQMLFEPQLELLDLLVEERDLILEERDLAKGGRSPGVGNAERYVKCSAASRSKVGPHLFEAGRWERT